jgi:hypothetical protein
MKPLCEICRKPIEITNRNVYDNRRYCELHHKMIIELVKWFGFDTESRLLTFVAPGDVCLFFHFWQCKQPNQPAGDEECS